MILAFFLRRHDLGLNQTLTAGCRDLSSVPLVTSAVADLQLGLLIKLSQVVKWAACELVYWEINL